MRTRALFEGVMEGILSLGILAAGWLYPAWFLGRDAIMRHETDTRLGPAFLFCLVGSFILAVLAVRSFRRARTLEPSCISK